jgi:hypothetical protein
MKQPVPGFHEGLVDLLIALRITTAVYRLIIEAVEKL